LIFHELFTAYNHSAAGHTADDSKRDNAGTAPSPLLPESWKKRFIQVLGALFFLSGLYIKSRAQSPVI